MDERENRIFSFKKEKSETITEEGRWEIFTPISIIILSVMSVVFIHSAQAYTGGNKWEMQAVWVLCGIIIYVIVSLVDYHFWMRFAHISYIIGIASLFLVFIWPERYGAQRWIDLHFLKFNPQNLQKL